jgi:MFS family permease
VLAREPVMLSVSYSQLLKQNRNFRRLWTGQMISELGTWFSFVAELGLVRLLSGSPMATTALLVARLLPFLLVAPLAGVLVDRRSRKNIMIAADLLRGVVALGYVAAAPLGAVWLVIVLSALNSSLTIFFEGAKNAAMPNMVTPRELLTANVMMFSTRFLQFTLGAALGGVTAAQFGYDTAFVVNSLSYVVSALYVWMIPVTAMRKGEVASEPEDVRREAWTPVSSLSSDVDNGTISALSAAQATAPAMGEVEQARERATARFASDLRGGLAYIWATPFVRGILLVNIGWATGGGMINLIYDRLGGHTFAGGAADRGDWNVAALFTAGGAGLFFGMLLARRAGVWVAEVRRAGRFIGWALIAQGVFLAMASFMPTLALMAVWIAASRFVLAAEFGVQETLMMRVLPDEYRGRVFTTDRSLELAVMALSTVVGGWMLTRLDPRVVMLISGLLSASPGFAWLLAMRMRRIGVPTQAVQESYGD